jgi:gliding motility-associated lipoprotein GldH
MSRKNRWTITAAILVVMVLAACQKRPFYSHYEPVSVGGWEKEDTVSFEIGPSDDFRHYTMTMGLRATMDFPYRNLSLVVRQEARPSGISHSDTIDIAMTDRDGIPLGKGVSHLQYDIPLSTIAIVADDTLRVSIHHNMNRYILPGITDIGLTLAAQQQP